ncbi:hypothetical protein BDZ94DRAFT_1308390 [Collybia nuda]|uniref:Uncharacterized protein n=1 Tax=Collybia nuda TaxID=64659 RepID=A0A9P6CKL4_9AGAR|nr:hypothetical protein BDZ94DRAFT_1308390 [Collybia nuda]
MFAIFLYLSVLSPTVLITTRVVDTPFAPTNGALSYCLLKVCTVLPRHGTTLQDFVEDIPRLNLPTIDAAPQIIVPEPNGEEGDGGGGGGGCCQSKELEERPNGSPSFLPHTLHRSDIVPFTWEASPYNDIKLVTSSSTHRQFPGATYPMRPLTGPRVGALPPNPNLSQGLWPDRDRFLALMSSGGLGRNGSMPDWSVFINNTADCSMQDPALGETQEAGIALSTPPFTDLKGTLPHAMTTLNTTGETNSTPTTTDPIGPKVELPSSALFISRDLSLYQERHLTLNGLSALVRNTAVFSWGLRLIVSILKLGLGHSRIEFTRNIIIYSSLNSQVVVLHTLPSRLVSKTPHLPAQPRCLASDKARYILNETCPYVITGDIADDLPQGPASYPSLDLPRCQLSDKEYHLLNNTCHTSERPSPPKKAAAHPRAVPQPRCLLVDKALHLLNGTCVSATVEESSRPTVETEAPHIDAIPFHPISTFSLPCFDSNRARRGLSRNCGFYAPPSLDMALNWDIKSQVALLNSQMAEAPTLFIMPADPATPTCCKHCRYGTGTNACIDARARRSHEPTTLLINPQLRSIRTRYTVAATLATLRKGFLLVNRAGRLEGWIALAVALITLCQTLSLPRLSKKYGGAGTVGLPIIPKHKEAPTKAKTVKLVDVKTAPKDVALPTTPRTPAAKVVPKGDAPTPATPKSTPSPAKGKARIVAGRRVQPSRKAKTPSPSASASSESTSPSGKKGRESKQAKRS